MKVEIQLELHEDAGEHDDLEAYCKHNDLGDRYES